MKRKENLFVILMLMPGFVIHGCGTAETVPDETAFSFENTVLEESPVENSVIVGTKWNPGHYAFITINSDKKFFTVDPAALFNFSKIQFDKAYLDKFLKDIGTNFMGIQIGCVWSMLEPKENIYDFSFIDTVLKVCADNNKQLQLLFSDRIFNSAVIPVPDYITKDPRYGGGYGKFSQGIIMAFWNQNVLERHYLLIQKLGERYNRNKNFELICFSESAFSFGSQPVPKGADGESYLSYLKKRVETAKAYFPNTVVLQGFNWGWANVIPEHCLENAAGFYGPDVVPDKERFPAKNRIVAYEYYEKSAGHIPLKCDVQSPELKKPIAEWGKFTIEGIYEMGVDTLKLNYMSWVVVEWGSSYYSFSKDIKPYIDSKNGEIKNTQIPKLIAPVL